MSVLVPSIASADALLPLPLYRFSVDQYHALLRAGILADGDPVELLEGLLVCKMTKHPPHVFATQTLRDLLPRLLPAGWFVSDQEPLTTSDSEPEPDGAVVRGQRRDYLGGHPGPADMALAIEVADSSLAHDRTVKQRIYARAGVPVYWIVNLVDHQVEVHSDPTGPSDEPAYRQRQAFGRGDTVPVVLDGREVGRLAVADLLP